MKRATFIAAILMLLSGLTAAPILAADTPGLGLEIGPSLVELTANPGQTVSFKIQLRDVTSAPIIATPQANNFSSKDEEGDPAILFNDPETRYSLKEWVQLPQPFTLTPKELRTVAITINVPGNAEPGGHYAVVRFSASPGDPTAQSVALGESIGTLVLLKVNGQIKEDVAVEEFSTYHDKTKTSWFDHGPITFVERLRNRGSVHERPSGYVDIYNMSGGKVTTLIVNGNPQKNVLPDGIRRFEESWDAKGWRFGRYRADLNLLYGTNNLPLKSTIYFWIIPFKTIGLILLLILLLGLLLRFGLRTYARRVEKRYERRTRGQ